MPALGVGTRLGYIRIISHNIFGTRPPLRETLRVVPLLLYRRRHCFPLRLNALEMPLALQGQSK